MFYLQYRNNSCKCLFCQFFVVACDSISPSASIFDWPHAVALLRLHMWRGPCGLMRERFSLCHHIWMASHAMTYIDFFATFHVWCSLLLASCHMRTPTYDGLSHVLESNLLSYRCVTWPARMWRATHVFLCIIHYVPPNLLYDTDSDWPGFWFIFDSVGGGI